MKDKQNLKLHRSFRKILHKVTQGDFSFVLKYDKL